MSLDDSVSGTERRYDYVDLGLPSGTMWATCNVGADSASDEGKLFQFGRVDGYRYNDSSNQFRTNAQNKQDTGNEYIPKTASGKTYNAGETLQPADDAANVNMGGAWRMPTSDELKELVNNTTQKTETINGVQGMMLTSNINEHQLFIPFVGYWNDDDGDFTFAGFYDFVWSSQVLPSDVNSAYILYCYSYGNANISSNRRSSAFSVRGVFKTQE